MRGYGRYYGAGRGYGYGFGPCNGYGWHNAPDSWETEDYEYVGPCRCGFGPDAFWRDKKTGRIVRGFPPYFQEKPEGSAEELREELEFLRREKEKLEKRLAQIEEELSRKEKGSD